MPGRYTGGADDNATKNQSSRLCDPMDLVDSVGPYDYIDCTDLADQCDYIHCMDQLDPLNPCNHVLVAWGSDQLYGLHGFSESMQYN